jgi:hypothetical protein
MTVLFMTLGTGHSGQEEILEWSSVLEQSWNKNRVEYNRNNMSG